MKTFKQSIISLAWVCIIVSGAHAGWEEAFQDELRHKESKVYKLTWKRSEIHHEVGFYRSREVYLSYRVYLEYPYIEKWVQSGKLFEADNFTIEAVSVDCLPEELWGKMFVHTEPKDHKFQFGRVVFKEE